MSGDGEYIPHNGTGIPSNDAPNFIIPPGNGSGCVTSGPFRNMTVRLGPIAPSLYNLPANPQFDGLGLNERCLRRDLSNAGAKRGNTEEISYELLANYDNILDFQNRMQGDVPDGYLGVHAGGHFWVGGDPGGDLFASPGDPYFFLHHGQIDRTWSIWQNQDLKNRQNAIGGTNTLFKFPPSANTTLEDSIDMGVNAPAIPIKRAMSTIGDQFCYVYDVQMGNMGGQPNLRGIGV